MEGGLQVAHPGTREKLEEVVENKDKDGDEKDENEDEGENEEGEKIGQEKLK